MLPNNLIRPIVVAVIVLVIIGMIITLIPGTFF